LITGFGGGSITSLRSSIIGAAFAFGIVEVTDIVVEEPEVEVCNLAGKGFPGAFLLSGLAANFGLTIFGERFANLATGFFAIFLAAAFLLGAFLATFFAPLLLGFFEDAFLLFDADFLNNLRIATIPPGGAKIMAWLV
jgi:hypothetical protein